MYTLDLTNPEKLTPEQREKLKELLLALKKYNIFRAKKNIAANKHINIIANQTLHHRINQAGQSYFHIITNLRKKEAGLEQQLEAKTRREAGHGRFGRVVKSKYVCYFDANEILHIKKEKWVQKRQRTATNQKGQAVFTENKIKAETDNTSRLFEQPTDQGNVTFYQSSKNQKEKKSAYLMPNKGKKIAQYFCAQQLPLSSRLLALLQISAQLKQLHEQGYAHGDIKPDNLVLNVKKGKFSLVDAGNTKEKNKFEAAGTNIFFSPEMKTLISEKDRVQTSNAQSTLEKEDMWTLGLTSLSLWFSWSYDQLKAFNDSYTAKKTNPFNVSGKDQSQLEQCLSQIILDRLLIPPPNQRSDCATHLNNWAALVRDFYPALLQEELEQLQNRLSNCKKILRPAIAARKERDPNDAKLDNFHTIICKITRLEDCIEKQNQVEITKNIATKTDEDLIKYSEKLLKQSMRLYKKLTNINELLTEPRLREIRGNFLTRNVMSLLKYCGFWPGAKGELTAKAARNMLYRTTTHRTTAQTLLK